MTATSTAPAEKQAAKPKDYRVLHTVRLDLSDPESVIKQLQKALGDEATVATVDVRIGVGNATTPRKALEAVADNTELKGDYDVVADSNVKTFKNVSTKQKRAVSIGG